MGSVNRREAEEVKERKIATGPKSVVALGRESPPLPPYPSWQPRLPSASLPIRPGLDPEGEVRTVATARGLFPDCSQATLLSSQREVGDGNPEIRAERWRQGQSTEAHREPGTYLREEPQAQTVRPKGRWECDGLPPDMT